ncbi:MAG: MBL fold metallo-hydrolase [Longimicrobiales bacterium]|nr:MBL fold metallo-hydrolase [Longimicrobiales bacterium]
MSPRSRTPRLRAARSHVGAVAVVAALSFAVFGATSVAAQGMDDVEIETIAVADGVYMLVGQGGNIGVSVGEDGVFVIDDQFAPLTEKILTAIGEITDEPVRFVFNTHWHGDHTGGNENMGKAGALIVAHHNVRERMSSEQVLQRIGRPVSTTPASPDGALPVVTFGEDVSFHINGGELHAFHVSHAHTDGDAIVHLRDANVVHMGDTFFRNRFPFIDTASGGSIDGLIAAVGAALAVMDADTRIIPGHGPLSTREDLRAYGDALKTMRDAVARLMAQGMSLEAIQAERPVQAQAAAWGQDRAAEDVFVATIHFGLGGR